jgi:glucosamine 6-phosphate synthetase-like amidotransferase/phosphosugar isomerase protein
MYCEIGEESAGPKTKGYFCAIVTNILFALSVAVKNGNITPEEERKYIERILKTSNNIPYIAENTDKWYKKHAAELKKCHRLVIVGYENNIATYMEGTLKILEAVRYSVTGYELDNFMHGVYHSIWENDFMFYIGAKGKYYGNMLKMKKYFEENRKNHNFIFTADKNQDDGTNFVANFIDDEELSFLEYIVPFQVIAARLSADLGINANIPSDPDFHKKMGSYK